MQAGAYQGHLLVEGLQQRFPLVAPQAAAQQLAALAQQAAVTAHQGAVDRFELEHHPVKPLPPQGRFAPHQLQIEGAESHAAQGTDQIELALQGAAVAQGLPAALAPQLQLQQVSLIGEGAQAAHGLAVADQVPVAAAAVGAEAGEQFHPLQQIRLAFAVGADHQQPRRREGEVQTADVAVVQQLEAMQPDGTGAVSS